MASSLFPDDAVIADAMRRLKGQIATPPGFPKDLRDIILEHGLMVFREWPSGHWSITDKGRAFMADVSA